MRLFVMFFALLSTAALAQDRLTLDKLLSMQREKFSDDLMISAIKLAKAIDIETSPDMIIAMKAAGLSQPVIKTLLEQKLLLNPQPQAVASPAPSAAPAPRAAAPPADGYPPDKGVYYRSGSGWVRIEAAKVETAMKGLMKSMINPFGKSSSRYSFAGKEAALQFNNPRPEFCIRDSEVSPRNIFIAILDQHKNKRDIESGSIGTFRGVNQGLKADKLKPVTTERISADLITFKPEQALSDGEYAISIGDYPAYDFGVKARGGR